MFGTMRRLWRRMKFDTRLQMCYWAAADPRVSGVKPVNLGIGEAS